MLFKFYTVTEKLKVQAGYSLLELTIVVLITGILAAILIPDISSTPPSQLDLIAEKYASAMRFARSESIRTGKP
ncbi:MAG: prepilin-type N-terminal cleavage/methylation domain-containing protein, partial [Thiotrichaceae bacterium]|nr:prepilin-type N-terminal cleavage/methylation domain-containing protein [Thiotrichaceae bacterium]